MCNILHPSIRKLRYEEKKLDPGQENLHWCLGTMQWILFSRVFVKTKGATTQKASTMKEQLNPSMEYLKGVGVALILYTLHEFVLLFWTPLFMDMKCITFVCRTRWILSDFAWLLQFAYIIPFAILFVQTDREKVAVGLGFASFVSTCILLSGKLIM